MRDFYNIFSAFNLFIIFILPAIKAPIPDGIEIKFIIVLKKEFKEKETRIKTPAKEHKHKIDLFKGRLNVCTSFLKGYIKINVLEI